MAFINFLNFGKIGKKSPTFGRKLISFRIGHNTDFVVKLYQGSGKWSDWSKN